MNPLIHALVIERTVFDDTTVDGYGQPVPGTPTETDVMGLVQPRRAFEADDSRSAGAEASDHVIFVPAATAVEGADAIVFGTRRFAITGIRRFEFGQLAHIEIDARLVTPAAVPVVAGS